MGETFAVYSLASDLIFSALCCLVVSIGHPKWTISNKMGHSATVLHIYTDVRHVPSYSCLAPVKWSYIFLRTAFYAPDTLGHFLCLFDNITFWLVRRIAKQCAPKIVSILQSEISIRINLKQFGSILIILYQFISFCNNLHQF